MNQNLSKTFDFLRFPLAILVVFLHIAPVYKPWDSPLDYQLIYFHVNRSINLIADCAVPVFFVMSGYLISIKHKNFSASEFIRVVYRRIITLLIPYTIWNVICYIYLRLTNQVQGLPTFKFLFLDPANFPLWFIRNLFILVLTYPIFILIAKYLSKNGLIVISALYMMLPIAPHNFACRSIYFFYLGIYAGFYSWNMDDVPRWIKITILALTIAVFGYELLGSPLLSYRFFNCYLLIFSIGIILIINELVKHLDATLPPVLAASSYFVYLSHKIGPTYISKAVFSMIPIDGEALDVITFLIAPFLTAAICVLVYIGLKRVFPRLFSFTIGGK